MSTATESDLEKYFGIGASTDNPDDLTPPPPPGERQRAAAEPTPPSTPSSPSPSSPSPASVPAEEPPPAPAPDPSTVEPEGEPSLEPPPEEPDGGGESEPESESAEPPSGLRVGDRTLSDPEAADAVALLDWRNGLAPQEIDALNRMFSGEYILVPTEEYRRLESGYSTGQPSSDSPSPPSEPEEEFLDPRAAAEISRLRSELEELRQGQETISQRSAEDQQAKINAGIASAREKFKAELNLEDADLSRVEAQLVHMGVAPSLGQKYRNDPERATLEGLKLAYRSMDDFIDREVESRLTSLQSEEEQRKSRRQKASSVSASGGSVNRGDGATEPKTRQERDKAIVSAVRNAMNGQAVEE